jgi:Flp pilus assembly protein TadB
VISLIVGVVLVIVGVMLWLGGISVAHALAILIGLIGILVIMWGFGDRARYTRL